MPAPLSLRRAARLEQADRTTTNFEHSLDWLDDGVALLRRDGRITFCNSAFARMAAINDGLSIEQGAIVFGAGAARGCLDTALASHYRLGAGRLGPPATVDFPAARPSHAPPYVVSVRPLGAPDAPRRAQDAVAIVFVRDPLASNAAAVRLLRRLFSLTAAEAALAHALQRGVSPATYARDNGLSPNTVYTHLRRIKEKTGWTRTAELSRRLSELQVPSRTD